MGMRKHRMAKSLREFVSVNGVFHLFFGQMPQHGFVSASWIEDTIDSLTRRNSQPVDDSHGSEHQCIDIASLDQCHLVKRDHTAREQYLPQRTTLATCFYQQGGKRVRIDEIEGSEKLTELLIRFVDWTGE